MRWLTLAFALLLAAPATAEEPTVSKVYSPFAVELGGPGAFSVITFEDVGMHLTGDAAASELLYETISQSVAAAIETSSALDYSATPVYEPRLLDPSQHVYCDDHHLYVALWRGFSPHRWGFSLWSGCGPDDQFAWHEVVAPWADDVDLPSLVEPLTQAVVDALGDAERTQCFQLRC